MKNLFLVAKCFAIQDSSKEIEVQHLLKAACATYFSKDSEFYKILLSYSKGNNSTVLASGICFKEIEHIFPNIDLFPDKKHSIAVKKIEKKLEKSSDCTIVTENIVSLNKLQEDNYKKNPEDEILDLFSKKLKELKKKLDQDDSIKSDISDKNLIEDKKTAVKISKLTQAKELKEYLSKHIFGQEMAINSVYDAIKNSLFKSSKKPLHTFFFLGPPGVGKTYLSELMTQSLPEYKNFKVFDMSHLQHQGDGITLYGTARNYGNGNVGSLTSFVRKHPKSIIIFDEFEKAHNNIQDSLLSIFSGGYLTDSNGWCSNGKPYSSKTKACSESDIEDRIDFSNTIIIITTNLGKELYSDVRFLDLLRSNHELAENMIIDILSTETKVQNDTTTKAITAPMLSRLSQANIALFNPLKLDDILKITKESFSQYQELFEQEYNLKLNKNISDDFFKLLTLQYAPNIDIRRVKAKAANFFFDKITDFMVKEDLNEKEICSINIKLSKEVSSFINEKISSLEDSLLEREMIIKNLTLKFDYVIIKSVESLTFTISSAYFEKIKKIKDFQGADALNISLPEKSFSDIAGHVKAKERLREIVNLLKNKDKIDKFNITTPKGVLLYGPPGTGKTMLASAIAKEADLPFIQTTANALINTPNLIHDIFTKAREYAPCIVFIDEIDAFRKRGTSAHNESFFAPKVNQLLTSLDGSNSCKDVFVVAATNKKDVIDKAILRAGRIDIHIEINSLDKNAREYFLKEIILKESKAEVDINKLLTYTAGMNGSQLQKVKRESYLYVIKHNLDDISQEIIIEQINTIKYGEKNTSRSIVQMLEETAYHEAGHAVVSKLLMPNKRIEQVTITPREKTLGFVSYTKEDNNQNLSIVDVKYQICIALAGRLSQMNKFAKEGMDTGAGNDLAKATQLAYVAIAYYGMDKEVGPISLENIDTGFFKESIEKRIQFWLTEAEEHVNKLIEKNWKVIDRLAKTLLKEEIIDENGLDKIIKEIHG